MMSFPEIRLGKTRPHTDRVKARAGARRRRMTSRLEVLEERTLLSFTPIAQPTAAYLAATTPIPITIADGATTTTLADSIETVTFSQPLTAGTIPAVGGNNWGSPPNTQSATPRVLFDANPADATLTLSLSPGQPRSLGLKRRDTLSALTPCRPPSTTVGILSGRSIRTSPHQANQ